FVQRNGDSIQITGEGLDTVTPISPLPTGKALFDYWLTQLGKAERAILCVLFDAYPKSLGPADIADETGFYNGGENYAANGGGFRNALGRLRTLELIQGRSELKICEEFFE